MRGFQVTVSLLLTSLSNIETVTIIVFILLVEVNFLFVHRYNVSCYFQMPEFLHKKGMPLQQWKVIILHPAIFGQNEVA